MAIMGYDHLVVRVDDLEQGIATYRDRLGLTLDRTTESEALGIKQAIFNLPDGGFIEVVAPLGEDSVVGNAIARHGEGMHTISFAVDDLEATCAAMKEEGATLLGEGEPQVYVHPKSTHGVLLQLTAKK